MEQKANDFLEKQPIGSLMKKYAVPCVISLLVAALYNIVDQLFIANASCLGSYGNAANTVVFPMTVVALAIAVMIGDGCCAFVSICLGAAVATVMGQILTTILAIWYLCHMKAVKLKAGSFRVHSQLAGKYLALGITSFLSQISLVAAMAAINNMIRKYGALDPVFGQVKYAQIPMAVVGIVMKFFQIVISISVGTAAGCIPIVGYNIGAGRKDRVKSLFTRLLSVEAVVGAVALLIVELFPKQLINLFGAANESAYYTQFAIKSFRIYLCMMIFATVNKGTFIFLQSLGKAAASTAISLIREVVFGVAPASVFGLDGVLYSMPVSDILTFLIAAVIIARTYQELSPQKLKQE